ncbi:hypothetical protein KKA15_01765 [Patescibacteria group bacterium]|nr:hypothetical protein [Patescibacteria group bacterium]
MEVLQMSTEMEEILIAIGNVCEPLVSAGIKSTTVGDPIDNLKNILGNVPNGQTVIDKVPAWKLFNLTDGYKGSFDYHARMIGDASSRDERLRKKKEVFEEGSVILGKFLTERFGNVPP